MSTQLMKPEKQTLKPAHEVKPELPVFTPRVDIWEGDNEIVLHGEMPGVEKEDLDIRFENRRLTILGNVSQRNQSLQFAGGEYAIGNFERTFVIGETIDTDRISAKLKNGILTLHLPKLEAVKPRKIKVRAG